MEPHLPSILEYLFAVLADKEPLLRSIACWTLSRYSNSLVRLDPTNEKRLFQRYLQQLLLRLTDTDPVVQEAACASAIALMDSIPELITPYAFDILQIFVGALEAYKGPALTGLYDAIGKLVESIYQERLKEDEKSLGLLLPAMFKRWNETKDSDRLLCPLLECFQSLIKALGAEFEEWVEPVLSRTLKLMEDMLPLIEADMDSAGHKTPVADEEFVIRSVDVIGELCTSLGRSLEPHLAKRGTAPANVFLAACRSSNLQVRQYSCALVGDLVKAAKEYMRTPLPQIVTLLASYITSPFGEMESYLTVSNNSCWTLGEIVMAYPEFASECASVSIDKLAGIFQTEVARRVLVENAAIVVGRLALCAPEVVCKHVGKVLKELCLTLRGLKAIPEKWQAVKGVCSAVLKNPEAAMENFPYLCDLFAECKGNGEELETTFKDILEMFKNAIGTRWEGYYAQFPADLRNILTARFGI